MEKDRSQMTDRILNITLEIIYLLTGEDYVPSKKTAKDVTPSSSRPRVPEGSVRSPITRSSPHTLTAEESDKKILQLTNKIIELMKGEVPVRCEDVAVFLSMEEWEYYEGHKDLYKDAMMEDQQPQGLTDNIKSEDFAEFQPTFQSVGVPTEPKIEPEPILQTEDLVTIIYNPSEMPGTSMSNESDDSSSSDNGDDQDGRNAELYIKPEPSPVPVEATQKPQRFYSCSECPKLFAAKADMMRHQRLHEKKALTCNQCGKIFPHKAHLLRHQCVQTEEQAYICSQCGESFLCKSHLVTHLRIHTGEKPLVCQDCGKHFSCNSALITHRRMHTGEKPYKCNECGKEYVQKHSLVLHQKFHTENKPFSCPECSASFFRQSHLDNHRKTHKGMRRYSCPDCGDFFMLLSSLIIHQKIHSAEKPFSS